jgi:hypothetical protein
MVYMQIRTNSAMMMSMPPQTREGELLRNDA